MAPEAGAVADIVDLVDEVDVVAGADVVDLVDVVAEVDVVALAPPRVLFILRETISTYLQ
jgi:hypothetical protein